jgi:proteasome lid subunit RPN8/RPN11
VSVDVWSVLTQDALATMRNHVMSAPHTEVGGFLLGFHGDDHQPPHGIVAIEAWHTQGDLTRLTFTHSAWEHVHRIQDESYPDTSIIGWYHSHPGHGIFLSAHDQFIQRHFFGAPWQIAVVIDPIAGTEGMFAWARGTIVKISERPVGEDATGADWRGATAFTLREPVVNERRERLVIEFGDDMDAPTIAAEAPERPPAARPPVSAWPALRLAVAALAIAFMVVVVILALR